MNNIVYAMIMPAERGSPCLKGLCHTDPPTMQLFGMHWEATSFKPPGFWVCLAAQVPPSCRA